MNFRGAVAAAEPNGNNYMFPRGEGGPFVSLKLMERSESGAAIERGEGENKN